LTAPERNRGCASPYIDIIVVEVDNALGKVDRRFLSPPAREPLKPGAALPAQKIGIRKGKVSCSFTPTVNRLRSMIMSTILTQVAAEYGALAARDMFLAIQNTVSSMGTELYLILAAVAVGLYLLVKLL
jgi:hypothetical protein